MSQASVYKEEISSQIPALQLLINMGWTYLAPGESLALRDDRQKNVVLTGILDPWLRAGETPITRSNKKAFIRAKGVL
jgi:type I restriction enzyme R subunit